ncbi:hypothetical protein [Rhodococcus sp. 24CO]
MAREDESEDDACVCMGGCNQPDRLRQEALLGCGSTDPGVATFCDDVGGT